MGEVAFWELAPYLTNLPVTGNVEDLDSERAAGQNSLPDIESAWSGFNVADDVAAICDAGRAKFGLPPCKEVHEKKTYTSLLDQQKQETNLALATAAKPNPGVMEGLTRLESLGITFCIATTSGKPRVP